MDLKDTDTNSREQQCISAPVWMQWVKNGLVCCFCLALILMNVEILRRGRWILSVNRTLEVHSSTLKQIVESDRQALANLQNVTPEDVRNVAEQNQEILRKLLVLLEEK